MKIENANVIGDKFVKNRNNNLPLNEKEKLRTWTEHYEHPLNVELDWDET